MYPAPVQFTFEEVLKKNSLSWLSTEVSRNGGVLIKDVPSIETVHGLLEGQVVFPEGGETWAHRKDMPNTVEVTNIKNEKTGRAGWFSENELGWHCNGVFLQSPETCVALYCEVPSETGGETELINLRQVYSDLSSEEQNQLKKYLVRYKKTKKDGDKGFYNLNPFEVEEFKKHSIRKHPFKSDEPFRDTSEKKLIYEHPVDGENGLYFPFTLREGICDMSLVESEKIFENLIEKSLQPKYRVQVSWKQKDLFLMDQIHSIHRRNPYTGARKLLRVAFWWK